jgi:hypothetical protein
MCRFVQYAQRIMRQRISLRCSGLKAIYKGNKEVAEPYFQVALKKPWHPRSQGMSQDPFSSSFAPYNTYQQQWNTQMT